ncbi:MAG TPA: Uma2 family endonuclease [Gemmatimonadales bacterium]|nr:Uma2 family endonuclease [Gemmatimonadales bacterium]
MPLVVPRYTLSDLASFPDDGSRYELLDGLLLVTPAPALPHERVVARIVRALTGYLPADLAEVFARGSVEVEPNVHLEPDVLVVPSGELAARTSSDARWTDIRRWWLAVEVSGEGSSLYDRDYKGPAYLALGVREMWRVDLRERCVFVSRPGVSEVRHADVVAWHPAERPEPLLLTVPELFNSPSSPRAPYSAT